MLTRMRSSVTFSTEPLNRQDVATKNGIAIDAADTIAADARPREAAPGGGGWLAIGAADAAAGAVQAAPR